MVLFRGNLISRMMLNLFFFYVLVCNYIDGIETAKWNIACIWQYINVMHGIVISNKNSVRI